MNFSDGKISIFAATKLFKSLSPQVVVFISVLLFYLTIWIVNPENKIIAAAFMLLILIFYSKLRDFRLSVLLTYLAGMFIFTGKTYVVQLVPPGIFPLDRWPLGFIVALTLSVRHIIAFFMLVILIKDIGSWKKIILNQGDKSILLYYLLLVISSVFASKQWLISFAYVLLMLDGLILYLYLKVYGNTWKNLILLVTSLLTALMIFESIISYQQFLAGSPVGKNIESQQGIEFFGEAVDELPFRFRPVGTFGHANELGSAFAFLLPIYLALYLKTSKTNYLMPMVAGVLVLVLTLSRASWFGFALAVAIVVYRLRKSHDFRWPRLPQKYSVFLLTGAIILTLLFIFPRLDRSFYTFSQTGGGGHIRYQQIVNSLTLIKLHPFLGTGAIMSVPEGLNYDTSGVLLNFPSPVHNIYLLMAAEYGIPAALLFLLFVIFYIRQDLKKIKRLNKEGVVFPNALGLLAGTVAMLVISFFHPFLNHLLVILGLTSINQIDN